MITETMEILHARSVEISAITMLQAETEHLPILALDSSAKHDKCCIVMTQAKTASHEDHLALCNA